MCIMAVVNNLYMYACSTHMHAVSCKEILIGNNNNNDNRNFDL